MFNLIPSGFFQTSSRKIHILAFAFGVLFVLSGCGIIKSAELQAIENSASVLQLTTGREVRRSLRDKDWGFSGPIYPKITIVYESINSHTEKEVYDEIVAILKKNNWEGDEPVTGRDYFAATFQQDGFDISTGVSIDENKNLVIIVMTIY
jgi:hypothetical protein